MVGGDEFPPVMTADETHVWVVEQESAAPADPGQVLAVRVDPRTGEISERSGNLVPGGMGPGVFPFALGEGGMWFYGGGDVAIRRLNVETMEVDESVDVSGHAENAIDAVLDPSTRTIWFAPYEGDVVRIDVH